MENPWLLTTGWALFQIALFPIRILFTTFLAGKPRLARLKLEPITTSDVKFKSGAGVDHFFDGVKALIRGERREDYQLAIRAFRKALRSAKQDSAAIRNNIAVGYANQGKSGLAKKYIAKAVQIVNNPANNADSNVIRIVRNNHQIIVRGNYK